MSTCTLNLPRVGLWVPSPGLLCLRFLSVASKSYRKSISRENGALFWTFLGLLVTAVTMEYPENRSQFDIIDSIMSLGRGPLMGNIDVESAYRNVPIHPDNWHLLDMKWQDYYFLDMALPFGLRSTSIISSFIADLVDWILQNNNGISHLHQYLDDFITLGPSASPVCQHNLDTSVLNMGHPSSSWQTQGSLNLYDSVRNRTRPSETSSSPFQGQVKPHSSSPGWLVSQTSLHPERVGVLDWQFTTRLQSCPYRLHFSTQDDQSSIRLSARRPPD